MIFLWIGLGWLGAGIFVALWIGATVRNADHQQRMADITQRRLAREQHDRKVAR